MSTTPGAELASIDFSNLIGGPLNAVITAQSMAAQSTAAFIKEVGFYKEGQKDSAGNDIGNTPVYVNFKYPKEISPFQPGKLYLKIRSIEVIDGGSGYADTDTVTFSAPAAGETANAKSLEVKVDNNGKITSIDMTGNGNAGSYLTAPTITINSATGTGAVVTVKTEVDRMDNPISAVYQDMQFSVPILTMLPIPFIKVDILKLDFNAKITSVETQSQNTDLSVGVDLTVKQKWPGGSAKLNASVAFKKSTSSGSSVERTYSMTIHVQASQDEMPAGMEKLLGILEGAMISTPGKLNS